TNIDLVFMFFNVTTTTEIDTLSLHDALPIWDRGGARVGAHRAGREACRRAVARRVGSHDQRPGRARADQEAFARRDPARHIHHQDRKSTRLNSSHVAISYAVFCLKKKKNNKR